MSTREQLTRRIQSAAKADFDSRLWFEQLKGEVARLIKEDFEGLVQLLYRFDVSEQAIRQALAQMPTPNADELIAGLLVARRMAALRARQTFGTGVLPPDANDPDAW